MKWILIWIFVYLSMEKVVKIVNKNDAGVDHAYWANQSSTDRISALEQLRNHQLTTNGIRQRLQRVCRVIKRK